MLIVLAFADVAFRSVAGCRTMEKVFNANGEMLCRLPETPAKSSE